jgi:hypothetical protein
MKLKTLQELGVSEADIQIYDKVRKTRNDRNKKDLIHGFYELPMFYLMIFASAIVSTFISIFFLIQINDRFKFITAISFDAVYELLVSIFILNLLPLLIFLLFALCLGTYQNGILKKKKIEEEIYKKE